MKILNDRGFSLVEVMVSVGLIAVVGGGLIALNSQHKKAEQGIQNVSTLGKALSQLRDTVTDPQICNLNFKGKSVINSHIDEIKNIAGGVIVKKRAKIENNSYELADITLSAHDEDSMRTRVTFTFNKLTDSTRSQVVSRSFNIFTKVSNAGVISECVDPLALTAESAKKKLCLDFDPAGEGNCDNTFRNLIFDVKSIYCKNHPYLLFDELTGKCRPLDADKSCGADFFKGYDANGQKICYSKPPYTPPAPDKPGAPWIPFKPSCSSWSPTWLPADNTVCKGKPFTQERACLDSGSSETEPRSAIGSKITGGCCDDWIPSPDETCTDKKVTQENSCGDTREIDGTKTCSSKDCVWKSPAAWGFHYATPTRPHYECIEYFAPANGHATFKSTTIKDGNTLYMSSNYCYTGSTGSCYGHQIIKCTNGSISVVEQECKWGKVP